MTLQSYQNLIKNLPVRKQCFTTKRKNWEKEERKFPWFRDLNGDIFSGRQSLTLCRKDIFQTEDVTERIIKTIYWGYPNGMRGNHFKGILSKIEDVENHINHLKNIKRPKEEDFKETRKIFKTIGGLGLSTYSKLLYFNKISFDGNPCLILDKRLLDVFGSSRFSEFKPLNKVKGESGYLNYIGTIKKTAMQLNTKGENLEQFLFIFGNHLK